MCCVCLLSALCLLLRPCLLLLPLLIFSLLPTDKILSKFGEGGQQREQQQGQLRQLQAVVDSAHTGRQHSKALQRQQSVTQQHHSSCMRGSWLALAAAA